jgi:hypothetical protein
MPQSYPAPRLTAITRLGFSMTVEVEPREFEKEGILKIVYPDENEKRLNLATHLPIIMEYIKQQGIKMGYTVMPPGK